MKRPCPVSVVIPTLSRDQVLLDTLNHLLALERPAAEILVVDQTRTHDPATHTALEAMAAAGAIRWMRLPEPSIPAAMNRGLAAATQEAVLFLDDDIIPHEGLVSAHHEARESSGADLVAGRVIQPWQSDSPEVALGGGPFNFNSGEPAWISEFMGGNFSIRRETAMALGGFDENFVRAAYRFEAEFASRVRAAGHRILYEPAACLKHLKAHSGGTRVFGEHMTTWRPGHAVGAYYYALRTGAAREFAIRPLRAVATRYHLRHPWRIPVTCVAEASGMFWALWLYLRGPKRLQSSGGEGA